MKSKQRRTRPQELGDDALEKVAGGASIISPRDSASGLPTGKRQHKPVSLTLPVGDTAGTDIGAISDGTSTTIVGGD